MCVLIQKWVWERGGGLGVSLVLFRSRGREGGGGGRVLGSRWTLAHCIFAKGGGYWEAVGRLHTAFSPKGEGVGMPVDACTLEKHQVGEGCGSWWAREHLKTEVLENGAGSGRWVGGDRTEMIRRQEGMRGLVQAGS